MTPKLAVAETVVVELCAEALEAAQVSRSSGRIARVTARARAQENVTPNAAGVKRRAMVPPAEMVAPEIEAAAGISSGNEKSSGRSTCKREAPAKLIFWRTPEEFAEESA
jgi:hypothetical protein